MQVESALKNLHLLVTDVQVFLQARGVGTDELFDDLQHLALYLNVTPVQPKGYTLHEWVYQAFREAIESHFPKCKDEACFIDRMEKLAQVLQEFQREPQNFVWDPMMANQK